MEDADGALYSEGESLLGKQSTSTPSSFLTRLHTNFYTKFIIITLNQVPLDSYVAMLGNLAYDGLTKYVEVSKSLYMQCYTEKWCFRYSQSTSVNELICMQFKK